MIEKNHILSEIKRTAEENDGKALGSQRFAKETGIRRSDWWGRYWSKWGDALLEAGYAPNQFQQPFNEKHMLTLLAMFVIELGRFPVLAELRMKASADKDFPSHSVWGKLGPKAGLPAKLLQHCRNKPGLNEVVEICSQAVSQVAVVDEVPEKGEPSITLGFVYLMKFRSDYKIGVSSDPDRRYGEVATQLPDALQKIHTIKTDDPFGVDRYWHHRFAEKRQKGEWFRLSLADVRTFKRWKNIF